MAPSATSNVTNGVRSGEVEYPPLGDIPGPYQVSGRYHSQKSKIRVACVGAGPSGKFDVGINPFA